LFGNSVRHSQSGAAGGTVTVAVSAGHVYRFKIEVRHLTCRFDAASISAMARS
jgi:hypothetical protein